MIHQLTAWLLALTSLDQPSQLAARGARAPGSLPLSFALIAAAATTEEEPSDEESAPAPPRGARQQQQQEEDSVSCACLVPDHGTITVLLSCFSPCQGR